MENQRIDNIQEALQQAAEAGHQGVDNTQGMTISFDHIVGDVDPDDGPTILPDDVGFDPDNLPHLDPGFNPFGPPDVDPGFTPDLPDVDPGFAPDLPDVDPGFIPDLPDTDPGFNPFGPDLGPDLDPGFNPFGPSDADPDVLGGEGYTSPEIDGISNFGFGTDEPMIYDL